MTSRLLLTLLALLTGLSVQGSAVQARAMPAGIMQVAAVSALATVREAKAVAVRARPEEARARLAVAASMPSTGNAQAAFIPTVRTGIDRSRQ